ESLLRQRVRDYVIALGRLHEVVAAGHDDQVLPSACLVDHGIGLPACRQDVLPGGFAGVDVDGAAPVVGRGGDENQAAGGHHRTAVVGRADHDRQVRGNAERTVGARGAERTVPQHAAGGQLDRADAAVRRLLAQQPGRHAPTRVDVDGVRRAHLWVARTLGATLVAAYLVARRPAQLVRLLARHQAVVVRHVVVV